MMNWKKIWEEFDEWCKTHQHPDANYGSYDEYGCFRRDTEPTEKEKRKAVERIVERRIRESGKR